MTKDMELVMIYRYNHRLSYVLVQYSATFHYPLITLQTSEYEQKLVNHDFLSISSYNMVIVNSILISILSSL